MKRLLCYIGKDGYKTFGSWKQMIDHARDEKHNGTYYVSCPNITFKYTREKVLRKEERKER